jgi:ABC-type multidrug transport system fused ATPase/permease subunit
VNAKKTLAFQSSKLLEPLVLYTAQYDDFERISNAHDTSIRRISAMRFACAAVFALNAYTSWVGGISALPFVPITVWYVLLLLSAATFLVLVTRHAKHFSERDYAETMGGVVAREIKVLSGDMTSLAHGGEFLTEREIMPPGADDFALDLDIFGEHSLFHRINRTVTPLGYKRLAAYLASTLGSASLVRERQQALSELAEQTTFRHEWMGSVSTRQLTGLEQEKLQKWLKSESSLVKNNSLQQVLFKSLLLVMPLLTISSCIWGVISPESGAMRFLGAFILGQYAIWAFFLPRIRREAATMSRTAHLLAVYVRLFRLAQKHPHFQSSTLQRCAKEADIALKSMGKLARLLLAFDNGQSFLGAIVLNGFLLWDLQCISRLAAWRNDNKGRIEQWFDMLAEMDALVSMAGFVFNHPHFIQPTILDESSPSVDAIGVAHPFLPNDEAVRNTLRLSAAEGKLVVITGANMAGKSTFLRALGINTTMALVGLPVCAEEFSCSLIRVVSSMRTSDSLERHESYFFAELQRLKMIIDRLHSGEQMLIILDEILRGTNSSDKKSGTIGLLRQLLSFSCIAVIATHDTEIGTLEHEEPSLVRNYCFEGTIEDDALHFDYTLRKGVAHNKNATFLMQKMGIIAKTK